MIKKRKMSRIISVLAPAKINLALKVLGKRKDGFHEIQSLFQEIPLCDTLSFKDSREFKIFSSFPGLPLDQSNLVAKAYRLFIEKYKPDHAVAVHIKKQIPMRAGLGGGSSDAAATLKGLYKYYRIKPNSRVLINMAKKLGSDVPFFIKGGTAYIGGRGEKISSLPLFAGSYLLVVYPNVPVSTVWAYNALKRPKMRLTKINQKPTLRASFSAYLKDQVAIENLLTNDFEEAVLKKFPVIAKIKKKIQSFSPNGALMSGSGSSLFAFFDDKKNGFKAYRYFKEKFKHTHFSKL
jgi:4-diphosphocytidyl-2-C-methyl-D-erythritol kinase